MLFLLLQLGGDRYLVQAKQVVEVVPLVRIKLLPGAPAGVAGVINYHGAPVPFIDITELATGKPSSRKMSTRIILTRLVSPSGKQCLIGCLAEQVMETVQLTDTDFVNSGLSTAASAYLGKVANDKRGIIQQIDLHQLLPHDIQKNILCELAGSAS